METLLTTTPELETTGEFTPWELHGENHLTVGPALFDRVNLKRYDTLSDSITQYNAPSSITALGSAAADGEVIVLEADILFASNAWDLPAPAASKIVELAAEVPEGATVQVGGHTDSRPVDRSQYDFDNQQLSEHRAQAVADALAAERPDLALEVEGFGDEQPAVSEDPDDASTYAANRRVELRYGG